MKMMGLIRVCLLMLCLAACSEEASQPEFESGFSDDTVIASLSDDETTEICISSQEYVQANALSQDATRVRCYSFAAQAVRVNGADCEAEVEKCLNNPDNVSDGAYLAEICALRSASISGRDDCSLDISVWEACLASRVRALSSLAGDVSCEMSAEEIAKALAPEECTQFFKECF